MNRLSKWNSKLKRLLVSCLFEESLWKNNAWQSSEGQNDMLSASYQLQYTVILLWMVADSEPLTGWTYVMPARALWQWPQATVQEWESLVWQAFHLIKQSHTSPFVSFMHHSYTHPYTCQRVYQLWWHGAIKPLKKSQVRNCLDILKNTFRMF